MAKLTVNRDINYINKDFSQFREQLINYSQTYFPNTYTDFSATSPGMMFMEQTAYVGDVLSFYLDNQFQENFLQYARQSNNIYDLAYMFGYKPKLTSTSQTVLDVYQEVPAILDGSTYKPDFKYTLVLEDNSIFTSNEGVQFISQDVVDFSYSSSFNPTKITVSQTLNGNPAYYLLQKTVNVISAEIQISTFIFNEPQPFQTKELSGTNIIGVLDIFDSDNNQYYEVDYLGQETIFDSIKNINPNDPNSGKNVPYLLRLKKVQRRFITRINNKGSMEIQFGVGSPLDTTEEIIPNPNNVGLGLPIKKDKLTTAFSPTNFLYTGTYGISPSNTTLTVRYLIGGGVSSNIPANNITTLDNSTTLKFNQGSLSNSTANYVFSTFGTTNPDAAMGGGDGDTLEEIRQNTMMMVATQKRSVTADDYLIRALSMPADFGSITKAHIETPKLKDNQVSTISTLNLFVLSQNLSGKLDYASNTLKNNLRTYLSQYRVIGDNIEIRDAFIINIAVDFDIVVLPEFNNSQVLFDCIRLLQSHFQIDKWQINQPIIIRDLYIMLDKVKGVQTVKNVNIINKSGTNSGYSVYAYDIPNATQNKVIYPSLDPSVFEVRYPNTDIKGKVVPL
tara:strand:+ start:5178 stop:7031 length:1854 start_codon:yes stop_codon:yes gene_type:complete